MRFWHGDADKIVPLSHGIHQAALVPDSELTVVPGGGHFSGYETVDEVFDTLLTFWPDGARSGQRLTNRLRGLPTIGA